VVRGGRVVQQRARLFDRWDRNGGPDPVLGWWLRSPWRWLLAAAVVTAAAAALSALGPGMPARTWVLLPLAVVSLLASTAGLHDEWLDERHPDGDQPRALPSTSTRISVVAVTLLGVTLVAVVLLTGRDHVVPPDERAIAEALFGGDTDLRLVPARSPARTAEEVSVLETATWDWTVATVDSAGTCHVLRFEDGELTEQRTAADLTAVCTAAAGERSRGDHAG
jgi:hypothetical protein